MEKITAENQTSSDHPTLKSDEIKKKNINFSSVKNEAEEEEKKEKDLGFIDESSGQVKSAPTLITDTDSDSVMCIVSSDGSEHSYFDGEEWSSSAVEPSSLIGPIYAPICSTEHENFKEIVKEEAKPIEYKPFEIVGIGMCNLSNTCFLNAVVQALMHTVVLLQLLTSIDHVSPCQTYEHGFCVVCLIREVIDLSMFYGSFSVRPEKLVSQLRNFSSYFDGNQQEDAHEFLQCFLNQLESCCDYLETKDNIVKEAFGGRLVSKLCCCHCGHFSVTHEPLIDISLEVEDVDSVSAALESFTKIEKIEFSCEWCKTQGPFEKQLLVDRSPSVAVLQLKRFKHNGFVVQKVETHVSFPLELDMLLFTNEINEEEMKYDLYAVIVHSGSSISSGHYYSFIRCAPKEWYKFDDEKVDCVQEDVVLAEQAYIMFYAKRGTPWFSDYIQIHKPFVNLAIPTTSPCIPNNHASDGGESNDAADETPDQICSEDQLQDVEIKQACSRDEDFIDALHRGSHGSSVKEKKRKLEDSPSRDD